MARFFISIVLLSLLASPANAQFIGSWNFGSGWVQSEDVNRMNRVAQEAQNQLSEPSPSTEAPEVSANAASMTFRPSIANRRRNLAQFVEKTRAQSPANAIELEKMFASTDVISEFGSILAPYGLRTDNVADAYTVYWIAAWEASRSIISAPETPERIQAVKAQAARALMATPEFVNSTDAQKQELAEALLIQAALIQATVQTYASDQAMLSQVASAVARGAKGMDIDLSKMTLTAEGFRLND
jgi:hypothetical protein